MPASLARSYDQLIAYGPGGYCITKGALWAFLPGMVRPLRMNIADPATRPCYTLVQDEHDRVIDVLDLIEAQGMAWRWQGNHIGRVR